MRRKCVTRSSNKSDDSKPPLIIQTHHRLKNIWTLYLTTNFINIA